MKIKPNLIFPVAFLLLSLPGQAQSFRMSSQNSSMIPTNVKGMDLQPYVLVLNTEVIQVPDYLEAEYLAFLKEGEAVFAQRYKRYKGEARVMLGLNHALERQMFKSRKERSEAELIPMLLERNLQMALHEYFTTSVCYAVNIHRVADFSIDSIAKLFQAQMVISPVSLELDTVAKGFSTRLHLEVWDSRQDSFSMAKIVPGTGASIGKSINNSLEKFTGLFISKVLMDPQYRKTAGMILKRKQMLKASLDTNSMVQQVLDVNNKGEGYIGSITNDAQDKFISFSLTPYDIDLSASLQDQYYNVPFPEVDLSENPDPTHPEFIGRTRLGQKHDGRWYISLSRESFLHSEDYGHAVENYFAEFENMGFFTDSSASFKDDFWSQSLFQPVDTAGMLASDFLGGTSSMLAEKNNLAPYVGMSKLLYHKVSAWHKWKAGEWMQSVKGQYINPAMEGLEKRDDDVKQVTAYRLIHDYELSKILIPASVEEPGGEVFLRFFYWTSDEPDELYEWNYFPKKKHENTSRSFGKSITRQMGQVMPFTFHYDFLYDPGFWNEYVVKMKAGQYQYLTKS